MNPFDESLKEKWAESFVSTLYGGMPVNFEDSGMPKKYKEAFLAGFNLARKLDKARKLSKERHKR